MTNHCKEPHVFRPLEGKNIVFGISGGIAAFKAADYIRGLKKLGANIKVVLTENGARFVTPLTFSALTGNPCFHSMFDQNNPSFMPHIELANWGDVLVILPASADIIGKTANGIADDLLTTLFLSFDSKKLVFPSMNPAMYENPAVQDNIQRLRDRGVVVVEPEEGTVVCGAKGRGRLPGFDTVLVQIRKALAHKDLKGLNILVTSGPTREPIDPIRFISNRSSGKMGLAIAKTAFIRGARVRLVTGPTCMEPPPYFGSIQVETANEMAQEVFKEAEAADIIIMAAAVADYSPVTYSASKIKKSDQEMTIRLEKTTDILKELGARKKPGQILVGFCAETEDLIENGFKKLEQKNLDLIVANNITEPGAGFDWDTNKVYLIDPDKNMEELPLLHKEEVAERIFDRILKLNSSS